MANGRIHAVVVATDSGNVVYERFYDNTSESTRAEIRAAFWQSRSVMGRKGEEGHCYVGNYRGGSVVFIPIGDVVFFMLGSGDYDELALKEVLETLIASLRDILTRSPSEALIMENYPAMCLAIDEIIIEGIYHNSDKDTIRKATKMKVVASVLSSSKALQHPFILGSMGDVKCMAVGHQSLKCPLVADVMLFVGVVVVAV